MAKPDTIKIDNVEYVRAVSVNSTPTTKRIAVLDKGWVIVGNISEKDSNDNYTITDGFVIRRWGTQHGLGELAEKGPLSDTILDKCLTITLPAKTVLYFMNINESKW